MNRFSQISTSAFDPLSLNEIMAIPLAKQRTQDALLQGTAEVSTIDSQRLAGSDKAVTAELESLRGRSRQLSKEILEGGYNRSIRNRFNELKMDQAQSFSSKGVIGKAKANFDARQANIAQVRKSKLSLQHQEAGLNWAINQFNAGEGEVAYQDYIGADDVNVQEMAVKVAGEMSPQVLAQNAGISWDPIGKVYRDGHMQYTTLPAEYIQKAVSQYLMNDEGVASYMNDMQKIGMITNPQAYIQNASIVAGNLKARDDQELSSKLMPKWYNEQVVNNNKGILDTSGWGSFQIKSRQDDSIEKHAIDNTNPHTFDEYGNYRNQREAPTPEEQAQYAQIQGHGGGGSLGANKGETERLAADRKKVSDYRKYYKLGPDVSDRAIGDLINSAITNGAVNYSTVVAPTNLEHTAFYLGKKYFGDGKGKFGDVAKRRVKVDGMPQVESVQDLADELGYDTEEMNQVLQGAGFLGNAPGDSDLPMGSVFSFPHKDGKSSLTMTVENDEAATKEFEEPQILVNNMFNSKDFSYIAERGADGKTIYKNFLLNPRIRKDENGRPIDMEYDPIMVVTENEYTSLDEYMAAVDAGKESFEEIETLEKLMSDNVALWQAHLDGITQKKQ